jgi:hypothetical protein
MGVDVSFMEAYTGDTYHTTRAAHRISRAAVMDNIFFMGIRRFREREGGMKSIVARLVLSGLIQR